MVVNENELLVTETQYY